jgi:hypothetical protein
VARAGLASTTQPSAAARPPDPRFGDPSLIAALCSRRPRRALARRTTGNASAG